MELFPAKVRLFITLILAFILQCNGKASIHDCVQATLALASTGDGQEVTSCAGCNPASASCVAGCQSMIDSVYWKCDSICLPDGYYFDPQSELSGCFASNQPPFKIKVERCGCNSASSLQPIFLTSAILSCFFMYIMYI